MLTWQVRDNTCMCCVNETKKGTKVMCIQTPSSAFSKILRSC